jgi:hypothetical protein
MSGSPGAEKPPQVRSPAPVARLGSWLRRGRAATTGMGRERLLELVTIAALLGGALLILAEFLTLFEIESRGLVVKEQAGGSHHAYAMLVIGVGTIVTALLARSTEQWPPAAGVVLLAGFALGYALLGDLPDATRSDLVRGARIAHASPGLGFWVELAGAIVAFASGLALVRLLRAPRRGSRADGLGPRRKRAVSNLW